MFGRYFAGDTTYPQQGFWRPVEMPMPAQPQALLREFRSPCRPASEQVGLHWGRDLKQKGPTKSSSGVFLKLVKVLCLCWGEEAACGWAAELLWAQPALPTLDQATRPKVASGRAAAHRVHQVSKWCLCVHLAGCSLYSRTLSLCQYTR